MDRQPDYYLILGVAPDASPREISRAYRSLVRRRHPDSRREGEQQAGLADVYEAYAVLRDPARRADYDRAGRGRERATAPGTQPPRPQPPAGRPVPVRVRRDGAEPAREQTSRPGDDEATGLRDDAAPPRRPTPRPGGPTIWVGPTMVHGPSARRRDVPDLVELLRELRRRSL